MLPEAVLISNIMSRTAGRWGETCCEPHATFKLLTDLRIFLLQEAYSC